MPKRPQNKRKKCRRNRSPTKGKRRTFFDPLMYGHLGNQIGEESEALVHRLALALLYKKCFNFPIRDIIRTQPNFPVVDLYVSTDLGNIPVQVKSSPHARRNFRKKYPNVLCIATRGCSVEEIEQCLMTGLEDDYQKLLTMSAH